MGAIKDVKNFCVSNVIDILDFNTQYLRTRGKPRHKNVDTFVTMENRFRYDIFTTAIDFQLQELNNRLCDLTMELIIFSSALSLKDVFKSFKVDYI